MARLGEAYVRVRADLKDYDADLDKALKRSTDRFEKALNANLGKRVGKTIGEGVESELDASLRDATKRFADDFESKGGAAGRRGGRSARKGFDDGFDGFPGSIFFEAIGGAITDGLSGLPPQIKALLGATVVAASVPLAAGLTAALLAGTAAGVAGLGIALASQFDVVNDAGITLGRDLRETLVESSRPFIEPLLQAFARIDSFTDSIAGRLNNTFQNAAQFVEPLSLAVIGLLDSITAGIDDFAAENSGIVDALSEGIIVFGDALDQSLGILGNLGEDGEKALQDLLFAISDILVVSVRFLAFMTRTEGVIRDLATGTDDLARTLQFVSPLLLLLGLGFKDSDEAAAAANAALAGYADTTGRYEVAADGAVRATKAETKALNEQAKAIEAARDAQFKSIDVTLSYLDSLDNVTATLKENKGAFDFQSKAGREGIASVGEALRDAEARARQFAETGKLTSEQAQELYRQEREEIYRNATAQGVNKAAIDAVYGSVSELLGLPAVPNVFGSFTGGALSAAEAARELRREIRRGGFTPSSVGIGEAASVPGYADGTFSTRQHLAMISEGNQPEVVLPLNNPRRSRELAAQSGLMNVLGGDGASTVIVYVGNEQLDSRMYRVARNNSQAQARQMTQGPRLN